MNRIKNFFYRIWIWILFLKYKNTLPTTSEIENPKMEFEFFSEAFIWEDEGLWEINHRLANAFKPVICHRMKLVIGSDCDLGVFVSAKFDEQIFGLAKRYFSNWIGFHSSRCSYNQELSNRMLRIRKVVDWRMEKLLNE